MKKMYLTPETKVSEFKTQLMCVSIEDDKFADDNDALTPPRGNEDSDWGNLWNE